MRLTLRRLLLTAVVAAAMILPAMPAHADPACAEVDVTVGTFNQGTGRWCVNTPWSWLIRDEGSTGWGSVVVVYTYVSIPSPI